MIVNTSKKSLCETLRAFYERKETCSKLIDFNIPTLVIVGKEDKVTPVATAQLIQENIKESILYVLEYAGHLSNLENSVEFNNQLEEFVSMVYH